MTLIQHLADIIGAGLLGAFLVAAFCLTAADRRGYNRAKEEERVVEGVELARPVLLPDEAPIGAEPASGQVRVGVTGRSLAPRTSGNAAPQHTNAQPLPQTGAPAGSLLHLLDDEPDREKYPHWPWTVLPLEPGIGEHDEEPRPRIGEDGSVSWANIARRLRQERINTPTAEFHALVGASWTPEETATLELSEVAG